MLIFFIRGALRAHALLQVLLTIPGHLGYGPNGTSHHFIHHTKFNYNFGNQLYWDIRYGTDYKGKMPKEIGKAKSSG